MNSTDTLMKLIPILLPAKTIFDTFSNHERVSDIIETPVNSDIIETSVNHKTSTLKLTQIEHLYLKSMENDPFL